VLPISHKNDSNVAKPFLSPIWVASVGFARLEERERTDR
jgi:hypothetical protein